MYKSIYIFVFSFIASLVVLSPVFAQDNVVVVPNETADINANGTFSRPFNCVGLPPNGIRFQQIYSGSQIGQAGIIDKISFRLNAVPDFLGNNGFVAQYPNAVIQLSTTNKVPVDAVGDPMSPVFSENIGPDVKTVFSGNLSLLVPNCKRAIPDLDIPCPFDVMIPLQEIFPYDPANGSLLFDVRFPQCPDLGDTVSFDLATFNVNDDGENVSIAWIPDADGTQDKVAVGNGLVTEFRFFVPRSVPTLSEWGLIAMASALGVIGILAVRQRRAKNS